MRSPGAWKGAGAFVYPKPMKDAFDRIYLENTWGEGSGRGSDPQAAAPCIEWVKAQLQPGDSFLDVGCGDGRLAAVLAPWCARYTGVDLSLVALQKARQRLPRRFRLLSGEVRDLPAGEIFDVALVKDVIQHLPAEEVRRLLQETMARVRRAVLVIGDYPMEEGGDIEPGGYRPISPDQFVWPAPLAGTWAVAGDIKAGWILPGRAQPSGTAG